MHGFGRPDVLILNAAHQRSFERFEDIDVAEREHAFEVNVHAMFRLCHAAVPHMLAGSAIVFTILINADDPSPDPLATLQVGAALALVSGALVLFHGIAGKEHAPNEQKQAAGELFHGDREERTIEHDPKPSSAA